MKCYYHHDVDAIGICKNCSKGLCSNCAVELENGIACKDQCEEQVNQINSLINRNIRATLNRKTFTLRSFLFTFIVGSLFVIYGILNSNDIKFSIFFIALGGVFILTSIFTLLNAKLLDNKKKK